MVPYVLVSPAISWYVLMHGCIFRCLVLFDPGSIAELLLFEVFSRMAKVYYKVVKDSADSAQRILSFLLFSFFSHILVMKVFKAEGRAALASTFLSYLVTQMLFLTLELAFSFPLRGTKSTGVIPHDQDMFWIVD